MIRLRGVDGKEVVEMDESTNVQLIDGLHYVATHEVKPIGAMTTLRELRAFEMVQVDTGFDDQEQPRVMTILPKRKNGLASFILATTMALGALGCSGATYSYHYTCYGQGCAPPPRPVNMYVSQATPASAGVVYVDRPLEVHVQRDGTINSRRAAMPRRSK